MHYVIALILFAVELGGVFGSASAEVVTMGDESMTIEIQVGVEGEVEAVVAHLALPNEPTLALPLLDRGDGTFGVTTEVKPANYQVVFESLGEASSQSQVVTLSDLGVEVSGDGSTGSTADEGLSADTIGWGWLALAFGAASLAALAFWVLGGRDDGEEEEITESGDEDESPPEDAIAQAPAETPPPDA
jgi:hypothetical protein